MSSIVLPFRHRLHYIASYIAEGLRGVDFTMPDRMYDRRRDDGAMYYASSPGLVAEALAAVDPAVYDSFLDVGCGKGYVLKEASARGFRRVGGVEYDDKLTDICARNLQRLGLSGRVLLHQGDAAFFRHYGEYNCFYFFNPFKPEIMEAVIGAIRTQCRGRQVALLYYHPRYTAPIEAAGCFRRTQVLFDPAKGYELYIYEGVAA